MFFLLKFSVKSSLLFKKTVGSDDESDDGPELNMHFRISGTLDGQTLVMTQVHF